MNFDSVLFSRLSAFSEEKDGDKRTSDYERKDSIQERLDSEMGYHFTQDMELLGASSLRTISRGSLEIIPDAGEVYPGTSHWDEEIDLPFKRSNNSILGESEDQETENQERLVLETMRLSLKDNKLESS
jgi:hypothetical protein